MINPHKNMTGIYVIENLVNGKKYIGQGVNVHRRMNEKHYGCYALNNAIKKHGKENFKSYVLVYCEEWELDRLEIACISVFGSHTLHNGYNMSFGGEASMRGRNHSKESRKKLSEVNLGKHFSDETRKKMSETALGRRFSNESRKKMSEAAFGRRFSDETRKKMSESQMGHSVSPEARKKMSDAKIGKHHSDKTRKKMSEASTGEKNPSFGKKRKKASSEFFGVYINRGRNRWRAMVIVNKKTIYIGQFKTEIEAAEAYDKYVIENDLHRPLNFPDIIP